MQKYCPITYELLEGTSTYSRAGLKLLSPNLTTLNPIPLTSDEQLREAMNRSTKLSIQGVQPKLSARLDIKNQTFEFVDINGQYILKPDNNFWPELPANEAISMTLAQLFEISVPIHGLVFTKDKNLTYFIKRFDRKGKSKISLEDFTQLAQLTRDTKYNSSIENVIKIIDKYSTFPKIDYIELFKRILFNFVIGNEDMHLKNYSLIQKNAQIYCLSPAYDFLNTSIALAYPGEESALPLNGKKNKIKRSDLIEYLAKQRLNLSDKILANILEQLNSMKPTFIEYVHRSYLSNTMKESYVNLLMNRFDRLYSKKSSD